ncbi:MAG: ATP-binding protein [Bacteroidota bacterium]
MKRFKQKFNKIALKLIFSVSITTAVTIGVYSYFNLEAQSDLLVSEFERHANQLSSTIIKSTRTSMLDYDTETTHNIINTVSEDQCIKDVRLFNKSGVIIYTSDSSLIGTMVDKDAEGCYSCHSTEQALSEAPIEKRSRIYQLNPDSSRIMGLMTPIYNEKSCWESDCHVHPESQKLLGVLDITMCLKEVEIAQQESTVKLIVFALVSILVLSIIIGFFVKRWIDTPVSNLMLATREISAGNLNYSVKDLGNDELGILGRAFNTMTKKMSDARMQLFQSDKMSSLGRLAAGVAHEINNPLTGVLTYSSFLLKRTKNNSEIQEDLKVIVRETKRSREIVKGLLDFARQSVPKKHNVKAREIIDRAASVVNNQLILKHIGLEKKFDPDLPMITVDADQIQQVFINLIVNASDAIEGDNGKIVITTSLTNLLPYGITQIKTAVCKNRHNLIDNEIKIESMPTVKLKAEAGNNSGYINLDPIYGKSRHKYNLKLNSGDDIKISCPRCDISFIKEREQCPKCNSSIFTFESPPNGMFEGCTNTNCDWQRWQAIDEGGQKTYVKIQIEDNGSGIQSEDLSRIFEPFFSTKGQKGTGLGLAVIWGIIDNHNGTITVESEVGQGTKFTILLPVT